MYAFVDETGNTGSNIFDENQPLFLTAALITKTDFDIVKTPLLKKVLRTHDLAALHASDLGIGRIEEIAPDVLKLIKSSDARFFISRVEKRYLVATKFFDTFFDSGENPAVPWTAYNVRPLRLILAFKLATILTDQLARQFWSMLMEKSKARAHEMIPSICDSVLAEIDRVPDQRSRQIITDALTWTKNHPEALDFHSASRQAKNGHMPNMVAFTNLMAGLEMLSVSWGRKVRRITHDRQSQFEVTLAEWHKMMSNAPPDKIELPGESYSLQKAGGSSFSISASSDSAGIQIADLVLWLFKRFLEGKEIPYQSSRLLAHSMKRGWQSDFSFDGVSQAMDEQFGPIMREELSDEQIAAGILIQKRVEENRLKNMAAYELDGLMPFERQAKNSEKR